MSNKILKSTFLFSTFVLLAQVFGLIRDLYLVHVFGVGPILDTYYLAFKIPDFLNVFYAVFLGSVIFIPLLTKAKNSDGQTDNKQEIIKKINSIGSLVLTLIIIFFLILFIFTSFFVNLLVPTWDNSQKELLINLSRILLLAQFFFPIGILGGSIGMIYNKPFGMATSGFIYNFTMLILATILIPIFGIYGLTYSVVIAAICFMLIQVSNTETLVVYKNFKYIINFNILMEWKSFIKENLGRFFAVAAFQFYGLLLLFVAGLAGTGGISSFSIAYNLYLASFFVLAASFSTALMPKVSEHFVREEKELLKVNLQKSIFYIFIVSVPTSIILYFSSLLIMKILYFFSPLTLETKIYIASLLSALSFSLTFFNILEIVRKYLYATAQIFWAGTLTFFLLISTTFFVYFISNIFPEINILLSLIWAMNTSIFLASILILIVLKVKKQI